MTTDYDRWLEQPYEDEHEAEDEYESASEAYDESDSYWEDLNEYMFANPGKDEDDFRDSNDYKGGVEHYLEMLNTPPDPPADREYRTRGWG
jgi:hypothetical protein